MDPNALTYAAEMLLRTYLYSSAAVCSLTLMIAALNYNASRQHDLEGQ